MLQLIYYPLAVCFSRYCFRHFKQYFSQNGQMFQVNNGRNNEQNVNGGNYQSFNNERVEQPPVLGRGNENVHEMVIRDGSLVARYRIE